MIPLGIRGGVRLHVGFNIRLIPQPNGMPAEYAKSSITSYDLYGLDHGIGHLTSMRPQKNERLNPNRG